MCMTEHKINMTVLLNLSSIFPKRYLRNLEIALHLCRIHAISFTLIGAGHNPNKSSGVSLFQK